MTISVLLLATYGAVQIFKIKFPIWSNKDKTVAASADQQEQSHANESNDELTRPDLLGTDESNKSNKNQTTPKSLVQVVKEVEPSVVRVTCGDHFGSGFIVNDRYTVITNYHVVAGARSAFVTFANGNSIRVVGTKGVDEGRDLAILHLESPSTANPLRLAPNFPDKGSEVITFGSPEDLSFSVSQGIVSGIRNTLELQIVFNEKMKGSWIQTTAPISPGNSGGPLVNLVGEVVGANTFRHREGQNLNFAISAADIRDLLKQSKDLSVVSLSPTALPTTKSESVPGPLDIVDYSGTESGNQMLREIDQMAIRVAFLDAQIQSPLPVLIQGKVEAILRSVGIMPIEEIIPGKPVALCLIATSRTRYGGISTTLYLTILQRAAESDRPIVVTLYEDAHVLATVSQRQIKRSLDEFGNSNKRKLAAIRKVSPSEAADKFRLFDAEERATAKLALVKQFMDQGKTDTAVRWLREIRDPHKGYPGTKAASLAGKQLAAMPGLSADSEANRELNFARALVTDGQLEMAIWYYKEVIQLWPKTQAASDAEDLLNRIGEFE